MSSNKPDIRITLSSMSEMLKFDYKHPGKETAGLLIGEEVDGIVYIHSIRAGKQRGNAVHVEINDEELMHAAIEISESEDGKVIVGWFHTHPGLTAFMSPTDVRTQSHYQALMPKAVAIVIDGLKYEKTKRLSDLDFGVFRIINGKATKVSYEITNAVEYGLSVSMDHSENYVEPVAPESSKSKYYAPVLSKSQIKRLKLKLDDVQSVLSAEDKNSLELWFELAEGLQDGTFQEVPLDVGNILNALDDSLLGIDELLDDISDQLLNQQAQRSLFFILITIIFEFFAFFAIS